MEFRLAVFFLFLYYIRPQDWIGGMAGFNIIRPLIVIWAWALFSSRSRSPVPGILRTPHDWCMLLYFGWVLWMGAGAQSAFSGFLPLVIFYAFTLHSLGTWERIKGFLKAWNFMLLGVAVIALASLMKVDLTGAVDLTMKAEGRLCIGTWMHNNPNALGHSMAVVMPLSYMLHFWRGNVLGRFVIFPAQSTLALWCIYETQSKGAFLVTGLLMVLLFVVGRPLLVKAFALTVALSLGVSALSFLPRMSQVGNLRADEGVQGRLMAWELAKTAMEQRPAGWKQFIAYINWRGITEAKATHSSYVQVGADLGIQGMALYLLALWAAYRTTVHAARTCRDEDDRERSRRALMVLIIAYATSGWMINREYHTEYFLLIAAAAAMHRLCLSEQQSLAFEPGGDPIEGEDTVRSWSAAGNSQTAMAWPALVPVAPGFSEVPFRAASAPLQSPVTAVMATAGAPVLESLAGLAEGESARRFRWNRLNWPDLGAAVILTWAVIYVWEYILKNL
ncbi:MAG: O-antigen ligase family protein [Verrucomicrobiaceae bacterium]|nr:O-antigen ligase family protein [Verrucomicrobiaceae bacterium]